MLGVLLAMGVTLSGWPPLPESGFIRGRVATQEDIAEGNAAFYIPEGRSTAYRAVTIPQYALYRNERGETERVILIQAEQTDKGIIVGLLSLRDTHHVVMLHEVTLLGQTPR